MIIVRRAGILLVGHGTRNDAGAAEFFQLADRLRRILPDRPVEAGFLELRRPSIADAWQRLIERAVTQIDAVPLLLFAAGHAKQDIPAALRACAAGTPTVPFRLTRPLSRHPALVRLAVRRAEAAVGAASPGDVRRTALVVVGRGNHDPCARTDLRVLVQMLDRALRRSQPLRRVEAAFYAMAAPRLTETLDRLAADPAIDTVIVQPHLLFTGQVAESIHQQMVSAAQRHRTVRFCRAEHLGPDPLLAEALAGRIAELQPPASPQRIPDPPPCCCT